MQLPRLFLLICLVAGAAAAFAEDKSEIPNFALLDQNGKFHELRRAQGKAVVLFFTANGCPIARQSISRLRKLEAEFGPRGMEFWMVDSNSGDDRDGVRRESFEFHNRLPVLMDETQGVAAMLGVKRTGTAVCIDTKTWTVFYRGAIDDQLVEGGQKPKPTVFYLRDALSRFSQGEKIETVSTVARGCIISIDPSEPVSYAKQVAPILEQKCFTCHSRGNIGPFAMSSFKKVKGMADMIQEVVLARRMPPWHADREFGHFTNDSSLSPDEARLLLRWIEQGAQRGEGDDPLENAVARSQDWHLGPPDLVVELPEPQKIPATGVLDYRHIKVPLVLDHDVWVKGVVAKPDNTRVVHHIIVRVKDAGQKGDSEDDAFLIGWAPGSPELFFPEDTGKLIRKGQVLEFEMHYTTSGKEEVDQSRIGLYLHSNKPSMVLQTKAAYDFALSLRPGDASENTAATYVFKKDALLFDLAPHMHLRGAWMKYEALYPNGKKETLLSVPRYDFKWQHTYRLKEPKRMPAGTWILCTGGFDNSSSNPDNPDPQRRVTWGDQSFDEMFIGFMGVADIPETTRVTSAR